MDKDEVIKTVKDALKNNTLRYEKMLIRLFRKIYIDKTSMIADGYSAVIH